MRDAARHRPGHTCSRTNLCPICRAELLAAVDLDPACPACVRAAAMIDALAMTLTKREIELDYLHAKFKRMGIVTEDGAC